MSSILDFTKDLDINQFDQTVSDAFDSSSPTKETSEKILLEFKDHPNGWTRVDAILKGSRSTQSQFFALQVLEHVIKTRWKTFSPKQRNFLKEYVVRFILEASGQKEAFVLNKFNVVLVEILKKEWPANWPTFISDLVQASQTISISVCRNALMILERLNEEVFMFSDDITTVRKIQLQNQLRTEYTQIFQLIKTIFESSLTMHLDQKLLESAFSAFMSFCKWMGPEFLFNTNIVDLISEYLRSSHTVSTLSCMREIAECAGRPSAEPELGRAPQNTFAASTDSLASTGACAPHYQLAEPKMLLMHRKIIEFLKMHFKELFKAGETCRRYEDMGYAERDIVREASYTLSVIYETSIVSLEKRDFGLLHEGLKVFVELSKIRDSIIFRRCLEFWSTFIFDLYSEYPFNTPPKKILRRSRYQSILEDMVDVLVNKMPRPEEVFITQNEYGEIVREKMVEVEKIDHFKKVKQTMFHLSFLVPDYIKRYFNQKLSRLLGGHDFNYGDLNRNCWAIGCISESFGLEDEETFFVNVIKDLLALCEFKNTKSDKAVVASNIMYIIGQYHRFLLAHHAFLKVLVKKLFEFMHEPHEGIKDMACDTFLRITEKCASEFYKMKEGSESMLLYILKNSRNITSSLEYYQRRIVYEAFCSMIDTVPTQKYLFVDILFNSFQSFDLFNENVIMQLDLRNPEVVKEISHCVKSYDLVYRKIPEATVPSYTSILNYFVLLFEKCCEADSQGLQNANASRRTDVDNADHRTIQRNGALIKSDIIQLFISVVSARTCPEAFASVLFEKIIFDYKKGNRNPLILCLGSAIVQNMYLEVDRESYLIHTLISPSLDTVLDPDENIEVSLKYFDLVETFLNVRFESFFANIYQLDIFNKFFNTITSGLICLKDVSDKCLNILLVVLLKLYEQKNYIFFKNYYFIIVENLLGIIFDKDKKYNLEEQCRVLCMMFKIGTSIPSFDGSTANQVLIGTFIENLLVSSFGNITKESVRLFVQGCFDLCCSVNVFRDHVCDFRVKIYEFGDNEDIEAETMLLHERKRIAAEGR